jgi:hypothetical protein
MSHLSTRHKSSTNSGTACAFGSFNTFRTSVEGHRSSVAMSSTVNSGFSLCSLRISSMSGFGLPLPFPFGRLLEAHKANAALGPDGQPMPDAPMFPGIRQKYADLDKLALLVIRPVLESSGLRWLGWHGFRRATASNLYALGADDLTVQRVLRHAKVTVTREHYIKIRDEKVDTAMLKLEDEIERKSASGAVTAQ